MMRLRRCQVAALRSTRDSCSIEYGLRSSSKPWVPFCASTWL